VQGTREAPRTPGCQRSARLHHRRRTCSCWSNRASWLSTLSRNFFVSASPYPAMKSRRNGRSGSVTSSICTKGSVTVRVPLRTASVCSLRANAATPLGSRWADPGKEEEEERVENTEERVEEVSLPVAGWRLLPGAAD